MKRSIPASRPATSPRGERNVSGAIAAIRMAAASNARPPLAQAASRGEHDFRVGLPRERFEVREFRRVGRRRERHAHERARRGESAFRRHELGSRGAIGLPDLEFAEDDFFVPFARPRDRATARIDERALPAVRDACEFRAGLICRNERDAVFARANVDHQISLHVLEGGRISPARHPSRRHHEQFRAALDERCRDGWNPPVGADEQSEFAERRVDRLQRRARREPEAIEVPQELLGGISEFAAVGSDCDRCIVRGAVHDFRRPVHDRRRMPPRKFGKVPRGRHELCGFDCCKAEDVARHGRFGKDDQACASHSGALDVREDPWPLALEIAPVVGTSLYRCDGYFAMLHETRFSNDAASRFAREVTFT
jgi:hypothetical protein